MRYFPLFCDMKDRAILVIGGGLAASSKVRLLVKTKATITVAAPQLNDDLSLFHDMAKINWVGRDAIEADLDGHSIVYCATGDMGLDRYWAEKAREKGAFALAVDQQEASDFITPAIIDRAPVVVAIGTEGTSPVLARRIKAKIELLLPDHTGRFAALAGSLRGWLEAQIKSNRARRLFWQKFVSNYDPFSSHLPADETLRQGAQQILDQDFDQKTDLVKNPAGGKIIFAGAGPGDPELLTLKTVSALREADTVFYDKLLDMRVLEYARREAKLICVGKRAGKHSWKQGDINAALVKEAEKGHVVVRLKGGDPSLFGRLQEELDALRSAGIKFEIIPGITAALAGAASLATPLTRRDKARGVVFLTGHDAKGFCEHDWQALCHLKMPMIFYMGSRVAPFIEDRLLKGGLDGDTIVSVVGDAFKQSEMKLAIKLSDLAKTISKFQDGSAILIMVGLEGQRVNELMQSLNEDNFAMSEQNEDEA